MVCIKKLPFSKAAEWASTQQAEFAQRYGIRCPDRKFHQLSARIPGLQAISGVEVTSVCVYPPLPA